MIADNCYKNSVVVVVVVVVASASEFKRALTDNDVRRACQFIGSESAGKAACSRKPVSADADQVAGRPCSRSRDHDRRRGTRQADMELGPDLQNILRQSYNYLTIMPR